VLCTLARCQAEQGLQVHVATTDDKGPERLAGPELPSTTKENVTYWIFPCQMRLYLFSLPLTFWLWKHTKQYDVVHIHYVFSYSSLVAALCAKLAGVPYVLLPHGILNNWGMRARRWFLKRLSFFLVEANLLRAAARVQYTCEEELLEAQRFRVKHKAVIVPCPVDLLPDAYPGTFRTRSRELDDRLIVLFLSRLHPKKGLDLLLRAFAAVRADHPEAVLVLAGDGDPPFVRQLKREAIRLGIESGTTWTGFLDGQNKRAALADADIFVLPSYSENFGVAVVEATLAGLPVIISNKVGIHRQVAEAQVGLVVECSVSQLESALRTLLDNAALRAKFRANCAAFSRQFSPPFVVEQLINEYRSIAGAKFNPYSKNIHVAQT
jgi:glycosyltransferase involved in cell wall biosynthesis